MNALLIAALLVLHGAPAQSQPGVITGRLLSVDGTPAAQARVSAVAIDDTLTDRALISLAVTDSSGEYRLTDIPPGRYLVMAGPLDQPTYFPGVFFEEKARAVTVTRGAVIDAVNFRIARLPKVEGRVVRRSSKPPLFAATTIQLNSRASTSAVATPRVAAAPARLYTSRIGPDGTFQLSDVRPGTYQVSVPGGGVILAGDVVTVTDQDVTNLELVVGVTSVTLRVTNPAITKLEIRQNNVEPTLLEAKPNGTFEFAGLSGRYTVTIPSPSPIPFPDVILMLPASESVDLTIAAPRVRRVILRTALERGGAPPPFLLRMSGTVVSTPPLEVAGFAVDIHPAPDGTSELLLPEGRYWFGAESPKGSAVRLHLKSIGGRPPKDTPVTVSMTDDLEIKLVLAR